MEDQEICGKDNCLEVGIKELCIQDEDHCVWLCIDHFREVFKIVKRPELADTFLDIQ